VPPDLYSAFEGKNVSVVAIKGRFSTWRFSRGATFFLTFFSRYLSTNKENLGSWFAIQLLAN
jgi:hypothetical protein